MSPGWISALLRLQGPEPKVALVLGGGAARGFAHIGVIQELERQSIPIDMIVGTSVGSLVGAIYACYGDSARLEEISRPIQRKDIFDYDLKTFLSRTGLVSGDTLQEFVEKQIACKNIEDLRIPFAAVATDLVKGEPVVLDRGSLAIAVRASCSIPGVFAPVKVGSCLLADGWVLENIPVTAAKAMGAELVVAVDVSVSIEDNQLNDLIDVILQSITIMSAEHMKKSKDAADVVVAPDLSGVGRLEFDKKEFCLQAGIQAAREAAPEIRKKIAAWKKSNWWRRFAR